MSDRFISGVLLIAALLCSRTAARAQIAPASEHADFLVAKRGLGDPRFKESVVLMVPVRNANVIVGLIINKPTDIQLGDVFSADSALKDRSDKVFFGGPIETELLSALFRSPKAYKQALHIAGDLYVTFNPDFTEELLKKKPKDVLDVRVFQGRAQWAPDQLRNEMALGAWYTEHEKNTWIFSLTPENVWRTLLAEAEPGPRA